MDNRRTNPKSENPKSERNQKLEIRNYTRHWSKQLETWFGLRILGFLRISGIQTSDFDPSSALCLCHSFCRTASESATPESAVRQQLAKTIPHRRSGSSRPILRSSPTLGVQAVAHDVLIAWTRESVYIYETNDAKVPDYARGADGFRRGKARAIRIVDGQFLKDDKGCEVNSILPAQDLTAADTDMRLRSAIQQPLDALALSDPNPDARRSAILKLGNSGKEKNIVLLQARQEKETNVEVKKSLNEAIALLQLGSADSGVQISAIQKLGAMDSIGGLDNLKRVVADPKTAPSVLKEANLAVSAIGQHIQWVNFFGTISFSWDSVGVRFCCVVALGLAITFGLMGVINMAHGEMIAVGAYTCYVVQNIFGTGFGFTINFPFNFFGYHPHISMHLPGLNATGWFYESYFSVRAAAQFSDGGAGGSW